MTKPKPKNKELPPPADRELVALDLEDVCPRCRRPGVLLRLKGMMRTCTTCITVREAVELSGNWSQP